MKRLFQRPASSSTLRSTAKSDAPSSPESTSDGKSPSKPAKEHERRSYSPDKLKAVFRKSSPDKRETRAKKSEESDQGKRRPASASMGDDELHGKVVEYLTAATEDAQHAALAEIHTALVEDDAQIRMGQKNADRLLSVCAQRLRLSFQRRLEAFNSRVVQASGGDVTSFLGDDAKQNSHYSVALGVLNALSSADGEQNTLLVVSERLPSTLVKVLKACAQPDASARHKESNNDDVVDAILAVLTKWVRSAETVHELVEASTFHRLFYLSFAATERQLRVLDLIEALVADVQEPMWSVLVAHVQERNCLMELLATVRNRNTECLAVLLRITAQLLSAAFGRGMLSLHKQLRIEQFYTHAFAIFEAAFQATSDEGEELLDREQQELRLAIGELCLSGSEGAVALAGGVAVTASVVNDACFALVDSLDKMNAKTSAFNVEAFWLVCQVIEFLHCVEERDHSSTDGGQQQPSPAWRQRLECQYIQKIGRLVAENRYDYVLIRRSGIMEQLLRRLHQLPDLSKHAVGSVLAATAIEANVIPYSELAAMTTYLAQSKTASAGRSSALEVLLGFIANLLRFHDAYRSILSSTGVTDAILGLIQLQAMLLCSDEVASTKINVTYPTSTLKIGHMSWHRRYSPGGVTGNEHVLPINERNLITFLTSHCRQNSTVRRLEASNAFDRRVFDLMMEILTTFAAGCAESSGSNEGERGEDGLGLKLCESSVLECVCVLLASRQFQEPALSLWVVILKIALRIRKQNTSTYNTVNSYLQSLRYVALALYYKHEPGITFAFHGSINVLFNGLRCVEDLLRPDKRPDERGGFANSGDRERVLVALVDSGALFTCLAILCSVTRAVEAGEIPDRTGHDSSEKTFLLGMRLIHMCVAASATIAELFNSAVTFNFCGDVIDRFMNQCAQRPDADAFYHACAVGLLGLSVDNYAMVAQPGRLSEEETSQKIVRHPGAVVIFIRLMRVWSDFLSPDHVKSLLAFTATLLSDVENARVCARAGLCDVLLELFGTTNHQPRTYRHDQEAPTSRRSLHGALIDEANPYHGLILAIFKNATNCGVTHTQASQWIKLIADASSSGQPSSSMSGVDRPWSSSPLLQALTELTIRKPSRLALPDAPAISFDASRDGFAQMQIPEVLVRQSQGLAAYYQNAGQSSSTSTATSGTPSFASLTTKMWPPADGYTVLQWFRIDAGETKETREKQYWELLMKNQCVLCLNAMKDDASLKCSHRACRACLEALANCGGECVVCNPPMFYLFRFRSGDAKSVSEVFLRGQRLYMRTSASTKTGGVHQFSHAPLQLGRWHHIALVHSRQRFQASQVSLYLNGLLQETVKISYPSSISSGQPLSGLVGIPAQARRVSSSRWTMGPFYLLEDTLSAHIVNCVFAARPSYGGLYLGPGGSSEIFVSIDNLSIESLLLLDDYTRDPIRTLIESVEAAERSGKNSILKSSLSLASAASSAAAAIVQDIKARSSSSSSIFARIPSAVPCVGIPFSQDRILLVYSAGAAMGVDFSVVPSGKLDGRPLAQLLGGAQVTPAFSLADVLHDLSGSGARFTYLLIEHAKTAVELELALELLSQLIRGQPKNLLAMENEHGYGIVNYLLHQKGGRSLTPRALAVLFRISGIDISIDDTEEQPQAIQRDNAVRNLLAIQHFILDYSLWQRADTPTQKLLFSSLYACLMASGDEREALLRERNRAQLQSLSLVRQLLYVFLDPSVEVDLVRIIVDLILVCLTGSSASASNRSEAATLEGNFAEIASFLASTLSPRFTRSRGDTEVAVHLAGFSIVPEAEAASPTSSPRSPQEPRAPSLESPVARLCLSPRGKGRNARLVSGSGWETTKDLASLSTSSPRQAPRVPSSSPRQSSVRSRFRQTQVQDLLLDILAKAVQKHDLKENRERDEVDGLYVDSQDSSSATNGAAAAVGVAPNSGGGQRIQLSSSSSSASKLAGFRKVLSPRWIGYFLFPTADTSCSVAIAPSTVIAALKLLATLLARPRYESVFRKEGFYRLLSQGLPCDSRAFSTSGHDGGDGDSFRAFPFDQLWYTLFCMLLGPPVDGMPHNVQFEMYFLTKDFALNVQRDRIMNGYIAWVILALLRRHYNDPIAFASLRTLRISPENSILAQVAHTLYAPSTDERQALLCHAQVLDFMLHLYTEMPVLRHLVILSHGSSSTGGSSGSNGSGSVSGSSSDGKLRGDIIEELSLLTCAVARAELYTKYAPTEKRVHQTLLNQKKELNAYEFAVCTVQLAEQQASEDHKGEDPFQHPVAVRALKLLVAILSDFLVLHPKGSEHLEAFFDSHAGSALAPPLHDGLQLRFQSLVMMGLLEQVRGKFCELDASALHENKVLTPNVQEFVALATEKMQVWQRAQHGDACPKAFACCGEKLHFAGGPLLLLDVALFVLGDPGAAGVTGSMSSASSSKSGLGQMFQDKINKSLATSSKGDKSQKRRHTLRSMLLGKVQFGSSKSAELDALTSSMHTVVNAVVLHILHGHGSEVSDDECEMLLQLLHINREIVLGPHNAQDRDFFLCLCRFLLQVLATKDPGESSDGGVNKGLLEIAAVVWIDLMVLQRALITELLTVEIRRAGGAPYFVNLTKNGFDTLLECPRVDGDGGVLVSESPAFRKFKDWLDVVGPPVKELETNLDRVYVKRIVEAKEVVREAWTASHKRTAHRQAKETKRFAARFEWFVSMEREYFENLLETQQSEFRRQLKWRQDRVDRHKFHARQWHQLRQDLLEQALRDRDDVDESIRGFVKKRGSKPSRNDTLLRPKTWQLDATEGPSRMRKRLLVKPEASVSIAATDSKPSAVASEVATTRPKPRRLRRRRFSESDVDSARLFERTSSRSSLLKLPADQLQLTSAKKKPTNESSTSTPSTASTKRPRPMSRRLSFENVLRGSELEAGPPQNGPRRRNESVSLSGVNDDDDQEASSASATNGLDGDDADESDTVDEKLRPLLVPGDEILEMSDCLRVDGMDACPGVFILASDHLYIVDNYQLVVQYGPMLPENHDRRRAAQSAGRSHEAKVMEVSSEAPTRLERRLSLRFQLPLQSPSEDTEPIPLTPSSLLTMQRSSNTHQCRSWAYDDVVELHKRRHQLRHVALELFVHDGRNYLITFESPQQRENVFHALIAKCPNVRGASHGMDRTTTSGDLYSQVKKLLRQNMTERWISREISNFEYLMHLNTLAGRSYNDLTQYPVFPWVLSDYTSNAIDLTDPTVFRDLSKPMGALFREEEFRVRYESLAESGSEELENPMGIKPFHYGTHYSSAGIVLHYLMRMEPFTAHFRRLQGGKFDHADRLFASVASAWKSAAGVDNAHNGTQDVKELTPEFFYLPSFLENVNRHDFGRDQSGIVVDDVELPPWANGSAREFVRVNREALESNYVSAHLHHWIDLIFGYKQQGSAAVEACNVFYHLTYEGAVDVDAITDVAMKRAMVDQISEFGQTPSQLFKTPHPPRVRLASVAGSTSSSSGDVSSSSLSSYTGAMSMGSPPPPAPSSGGLSFPPTTSRSSTLASSFIEGSDIVSRMHSILTNNSALGTSAVDDATSILDYAAMLQQEPRREVALNPIVLAHRGHYQTTAFSSVGSSGPSPPMVHMRTRQLSSGIPAAPIQQIAIASASVTRDERVAAVGDNCLLIPPKHHEFFAWGFQDRTLKLMSVGISEVAYGGESKVVSSFEIEFPIGVACMTSDGRTLIASGALAPVVRLWQFGSSKKSLVSSGSGGGSTVGGGAAGRRRAYSVGLHTSGQSHRTLVPIATLCTPSHTAPITAVQVCRAYSILVSGCAGGSAVLWDLNRLRYVRTLARLQTEPPGVADPCSAIAINEVTGDIVVACGPIFGVYDVNGDVLARLSSDTLLHDSQYPRAAVTSLAVNRSEASEWCREKAVITGHADGVLCIWAYSHTSYGSDSGAIELKGRHMITKALAGGTATSRSAITSLMLTQDERKLYTGNADGLLSLWTPLLQGNLPTTPTKSLAASSSPMPAHTTSLI